MTCTSTGRYVTFLLFPTRAILIFKNRIERAGSLSGGNYCCTFLLSNPKSFSLRAAPLAPPHYPQLLLTMSGDGGHAVTWTASELAALRQSIRENGLDDWTLGDWSEVKYRVLLDGCETC